MNKYMFSGKNNAFFPAEEIKVYTTAGWVLDDLVDVSTEIFLEFTQDKNSEGLMRVANKKGYPEWMPVPPKSKEQLIEQADSKKQALITEANQKTQLWQTQLMLDIITDEDKASLTEWMRYAQKVQAADTSTAPDIIWPEKPE